MRLKTAVFRSTITSFTCLALASSAYADAPRAPSGLALIRERAAHDAAEAIACGSAPARKYFAPTLHQVALRRWGLVTEHIVADTIELTADAVYDAATKGAHQGDALLHFMGKPQLCTAAQREEARRAIDAVLVAHPPSSVGRCAALPLAAVRKEPACALALATKAALEGEHESARTHVTDLLAAAAFDALFDAKSLTEAQKDSLFETTATALHEIISGEGDASSSTAFEVGRVFRRADLDDVSPTDCKDGELVHDLADAGEDAQDVFCTATRADLVPARVEVGLVGPGGTNKSDLEHLVRTAGDADDDDDDDGPGGADPGTRLAAALLCAMPTAAADVAYVDCTSGALVIKKAATFKLTVGGESWGIDVSPKAPSVRVHSAHKLGLADVAESAAVALHTRQDLLSLMHDRFLHGVPRAEDVRSLTASMLRLRELAGALRDVTDGLPPEASVVGLIDEIGELLPGNGDAPAAPLRCDAPTTPSDRARCAAGGAALPLLVAAQHRHVRSLAVRTTSLMHPSQAADTCTTKASGGLLTALASYVPDREDAHGGAPHELAADQLESAAREVAECGASTPTRGPLGFDIGPSLALRASWNSAYVNAFGSDGFRVTPSLEVLTAQLRLTPAGAPAEITARASIVDFFAPLVELAMRRGDIVYDQQGLVWLDAVRPRLDIALALPRFSQNLLLVAGGSLRMSAPFQGTIDPAQPRISTSSTYLTPFSAAPAATDRFGHFAEANLGVKYVF